MGQRFDSPSETVSSPDKREKRLLERCDSGAHRREKRGLSLI